MNNSITHRLHKTVMIQTQRLRCTTNIVYRYPLISIRLAFFVYFLDTFTYKYNHRTGHVGYMHAFLHFS